MNTKTQKIVVSAVVAAALGLSVPAMALDVTPYGAIRVGTWWTSSTYYNGQSAMHDADFSLDLQGDSLVGMRVKEGDFSGIAELGAYNPKNRSQSPELRMLFGDWDFGNGKLRVGYLPSPYVFRSEQTYDSDGGFNGYGSLWDGRYAQIKLTLNNGFYLDLMKQSAGNTGGTSNYTTNSGPAWQNTQFNMTATQYAKTNTNYDTYLPKTVVGYEGKAGILSYGGGVAFNFYKVTQTTEDIETSKNEIYSYLGFAHGTVDLTPFQLKFHVYTGQNLGNLMASAAAATGSYYFNRHNAYTYGGFAQAGYTLNKKIKMFTGVSYESNDTKESKVDDRMAAFANLHYTISKNFKVVPEFTYLNDMRSRTGAKEPQIYAAGIKWEMTF